MYRLAKNEFFQFELKNSWHFTTILCRKKSIIRDFFNTMQSSNLLFVVEIICEATTPLFQNLFNLRKHNLDKYKNS